MSFDDICKYNFSKYDLFKEKDDIYDPCFGNGVILEIDKAKNNITALFDQGLKMNYTLKGVAKPTQRRLFHREKGD